MPSLFLLAVIFLLLGVRDIPGAVLYRVGAPFTAAEKDSIEGLGLDYVEIDWSVAQLLEAVEMDSLEAGSLQPNYFDEDEDIAATLLDRGGLVAGTDLRFREGDVAAQMIDQDPTTAYVWPAVPPEAFSTLAGNRWAVFLDLGGDFLVREVRFRPLEGRPDHFLEHFTIGVSDERVHKFRIPPFTTVAEVKENTEADIRVVLNSPVSTRSVYMRIFRKTAKEISVGEFEVYGGGFVSNASYESDIIDLGDIANWGEIRWSGRKDPHARIGIRTRAGADPQPEVYWEVRPEQQDSIRFLGGGGDLSFTEYKGKYERLASYLKPARTEDSIRPDTENWSFWSSSYDFETPGVDIVSPGPRRFLQIKTDFVSTVEDGGKIDYIEFKATTPPLVRELKGEISPVETEVGKATRFTYYIKPTILAEDIGFDAVEISTPSGVVSVDSLRLDEVDQQGFSWTVRDDGLGFELLLPHRLKPADTGTLIEIDFRSTVLREVGTLFAGRVFDTTRPHEVRQRILPGEAAPEIESERLSVTTSLSPSLVFSPLVSPNPFTPNGDGINDVVRISYKLLRVTSGVPVVIEIFDLSGRRVREVYSGTDPLGEYSHSWDGTDDSGRSVPPGIFFYRILADLHSGQEIDSGVLSVAY